MTTTSLFVEILVIGIQSTIWIFLLAICSINEMYYQNILITIEKYSMFMFLIYVAISYTIGIVFDRLSDALFTALKPLIYDFPNKLLMKIPWVHKTITKANQDKKIPILLKSQKVVEFLEYIRSRLRIIRASLLNTILFFISFMIYLGNKEKGNNQQIITLSNAKIIVIAIIIILILYVSFVMLQMTYEDRLKQSRDEYEKKTDE